MNFCALDIETIPNWDLPKECIPQFDPDSVALGNLKDKDKIEAKIEAERKKFDEGLIKKMSLDPDLCKVIYVMVHRTETLSLGHFNDEYYLIGNTWAYIKTLYLNHISLITYNGLSFDLPVLWHSAIRLGILVDPRMYKDLTKKYDNRYHYDVMQIMSGWDRQRYKSFDFYLCWLGLEPKMGDGSMVYDWWQKGEYESIRKYCEHDVDMLVKLWEKLEPYFVGKAI